MRDMHVADNGSSQSQSVGPVVLDGHLRVVLYQSTVLNIHNAHVLKYCVEYL